MKVTITVWESVAVDSGLWPEMSFTGKLIGFNAATVDIENDDYHEMAFLYTDIASITFEPASGGKSGE